MFLSECQRGVKKDFEVLECDQFYTAEDKESATSDNSSIEESLCLLGMVPNLDSTYKTNIRICQIYQNAKNYQINEKLYDRYKKLDPKQRVACGYMVFYNKYNQIGVYFRHLYHIVKFIADTERSEIDIFYHGKVTSEVKMKYMDYAQFIQARMSFDELLLLFYNSFLFEKMQDYLVQYNLLENLNVEQLVRPEHNCITKYLLKVQKSLY